MLEPGGIPIEACEQLAAWSGVAGLAVLGGQLAGMGFELFERQRCPGARIIVVELRRRRGTRLWILGYAGHYRVKISWLCTPSAILRTVLSVKSTAFCKNLNEAARL